MTTHTHPTGSTNAHAASRGKPWPARHWAGLTAAAVTAVALLVLTLFSVLDTLAMPTTAQQTCPNQSIPASQLGRPRSGAGTMTPKLHDGENEEIDFGRSITARTLTLYLDLGAPSAGPRYFSMHANPFTRTDDATLRQANIVTSAARDGNTLIVTLCFVRERAGLSLGDPGSYAGSVTLDDSRLSSAVTIPITVTMQYVHGMLLIWLYVGAVLPGIWCLWVLKTSRDSRKPALSRDIITWLQTVNGTISVGVGGIAALSVYIATYLRDPTWGSSAIQPLTFYGAMFSAFITTAGLAQLAHPSSQPSTQLETTEDLPEQSRAQTTTANSDHLPIPTKP
jgi:hypothetical protein